MKHQLLLSTLLINFVSSRAKTEDLPLCPTNFQYFPQSLPMHCRMPTAADLPAYPGMPGLPTMQPLPANKHPMPVQMPPGMPGPVPMPGVPMPMPGAMPMMPGPMMPMPGAPNHKVPVIVMPFYSPDTSHKKPGRPNPRPGWKKPRRPHESTESSETDTDTDTDTDTSSDTSDGDTSSDRGWWKGKRNGRRRNGRRAGKRHHSHRSRRRHNEKKKDLLTPVLQYVTNDGYVIYEKTISKGEAKDWLRVNKNEQKPEEQNENEEGNASVHDTPKNVQDQKGKSYEEYADKEGDKEDEKDKEEVTTVAVHPKRHHRKGVPVVNKLLPKRSF